LIVHAGTDKRKGVRIKFWPLHVFSLFAPRTSCFDHERFFEQTFELLFQLFFRGVRASA